MKINLPSPVCGTGLTFFQSKGRASEHTRDKNEERFVWAPRSCLDPVFERAYYFELTGKLMNASLCR